LDADGSDEGGMDVFGGCDGGNANGADGCDDVLAAASLLASSISSSSISCMSSSSTSISDEESLLPSPSLDAGRLDLIAPSISLLSSAFSPSDCSSCM